MVKVRSADLGSGTFSREANKKLMERLGYQYELVPMTEHIDIAESIPKDADMGVIAYYNAIGGLVQENLDDIYENNLVILDLMRVPVEFRLVGLKGADAAARAANGTIYSHPKALQQCRHYLRANYKGHKQQSVASTAAGLNSLLQDPEGMALVRPEAIEGKLEYEVIDEKVARARHGNKNFTDFFLVSDHNGIDYAPNKRYKTMVAITPHYDREGLLADISNVIGHVYGINNTCIHSRPALDDITIECQQAQMFYIEMQVNPKEERFRRCVDDLKFILPNRKDLETLRVLGSYFDPNIGWDIKTGYVGK